MSIPTDRLDERKRYFEKTLKSKVQYRRIQFIWPYGANYSNMILSHALKNIEMLQSGYVTSWNAERFSYRELAEKIRRRAGRVYQNVDKEQDSRNKELLDRIDLIRTASGYIDYLARQEREKMALAFDDDRIEYPNTVSREERSMMGPTRHVRHERNDDAASEPRRARSPFRPIDRVALGERLFDTGKAAEDLSLRQKQEIINKSRSTEDVLNKMEAWVDGWLAGKLNTENDWNSFDACLDRPLI